MLQVAAMVGMAGSEQLEVAVEQEAKVRELKEQIACRIHVPVLFQVLLLRTAVLPDDEPLAAHHPGGNGALAVTVVVSFDLARRRLQGGSEAQKTEALRGLAERGLIGGDRSQLAAAALEDSSTDVRQTAVQVLGRVGLQDYRCAVAEVAARLDSPYDDVRFSAAQALREVARRGDSEALARLRPRLEDASADVREMAMAAFGDIAPRGDEKAIAIALGHLRNVSMDVRWRALEVLDKLVTVRGNRGLIDAVIGCLEMRSNYVRRWAVEVLGKITERGDRHAIAAVTAHMDHSDDDIRLAAGVALSEIADRGDAFAIAGLDRFASHPDPGVRLAAVAARRQLLG